MPGDVPHDTEPAKSHRDTGTDGYKLRRRTLLAATGTITGTVFSAGCLGDDTGSGDGANDPGEETTETSTENKDTETRTETETATETAGLPADMQKRAEKYTEWLRQSTSVEEHFGDAVVHDRNRWTYRHVGETEQGGTKYERIVDVWVDDSMDPLGSYSPEDLLTQDGIGDTFMPLLRNFSPGGTPRFDAEARDPTEPQVVRHTYRVQQGNDHGAPFAAATVPPTAWPIIKERMEGTVSEEEYREKSDKELFIEGTANYLLEDDRLTVQA